MPMHISICGYGCVTPFRAEASFGNIQYMFRFFSFINTEIYVVETLTGERQVQVYTVYTSYVTFREEIMVIK